MRRYLYGGYYSRDFPSVCSRRSTHCYLLAHPSSGMATSCTSVVCRFKIGREIIYMYIFFFTCLDVLRTLVGVPCIAWVEPAVCSLAALDRTTGLVFSVDQCVGLALRDVLLTHMQAYASRNGCGRREGCGKFLSTMSQPSIVGKNKKEL